MAKTTKFELINYFDVWGNKKDGFEINNMCSEGTFSLDTENPSHKDMMQGMKEHGFLKSHVRLNMLEVWDDGSMIEFFHKRDMKPLCRLELKEGD